MFLNRRFKVRFSRVCYSIIIVAVCFSVAQTIYVILLHNSTTSYNCSQLCRFSSKLHNDTLEFDSSYIIRHFPNFVCPQNFRNLADWVYGWPDQFVEHLETMTVEGKVIAPCLPPGSIIYVRIWDIDGFFDHVYPHLQNKFVLVTGEGDLSSPIHLEYLDSSDSKIIHWFGQNGQYHVSKSEKFTHIPIGINCFEMSDAIESVYSKHSENQLPSIFNESDEPSSYTQPLDVSRRVQTTKTDSKKLVLINFDPGTDKTRLRANIWKNVCLKRKSNYSFFTCILKEGGVQIKNLPNIYERNRQYPFWLSPRGNGLDCHRTWEALYLDIIPIIWNTSLNVMFENLPVLIINDYKELNETFLYDKLNEISKKKLSKGNIYQYEKLRNAYWRRLILSKSRHHKKTDIYERTKLCWRAKSTMNWRKLIPY